MPSARSTLPTTSDAQRLKLKPDNDVTGVVDGAWWPTSRDLATELTGLAAAVADKIGPLERMNYNLGAWDAVPRRVKVGRVVVRTGGFRTQSPSTVDVIGELRRLTLLIVPPDTEEHAAQRVLDAASHEGNTDGIDALLSAAENAAPAGR